MNTLQLTTSVLRDPSQLIEETQTTNRYGDLVPKLLLITAIGAGLFGAVVGSYRGGLQLLFAALKMPLLLLLPTLIALPALRALWATCDVDISFRRLSLAALVGTARTAILAAAAGPVMWLLLSSGMAYHPAVLLLALSLAVVGLPGLLVVARAVPKGGRQRWIAIAGSLAMVGAVSAQGGWLLRPFIARPAAEVTLFRPIEEDILSGLLFTTYASVDVYPGWEVESSVPFSGSRQGQ